MGKFDDFVESATYRLRPDPELRMDVARELRAHLEDAVEAAHAAGAADSEVEQQVLREFGDVEQIADGLWRANRQRMRLRAVAKWSARLILMPAAILLAALLCWEAMGFLTFISVTNDTAAGALPRLFTMEPRVSFRNDLTPDQAAARDILREAGLNDYEVAKRLVGRFPENRVLRAHMAIYFTRDNIESYDDRTLSAATVHEALALFSECERVEPENALYNYLKAHVLMFGSGAAKDEEDPSFTYSFADSTGNVREDHGYRLIIADRSLFQRGLDEYRKGLSKPYCDPYVVPYMEFYLGLRRTSDTILREAQQIAFCASQPLPYLPMLRNQTRGIVAYAALLIEEGRKDEAAELLRTALIPGTQLGARDNTLIDLLVARAMRRTALLQGAVLHDRMGMGKVGEEARAIGQRENVNHGPPWEESSPTQEKLRRQGGILGHLMLAAVDTDPVSADAMTDAMRNAERMSLERSVLGVLAVLFLLLIAWLGMRTLVSMWRHRKDTAGPKLLFIGWKRLGWIVFFAVVIPISAYALLTRLSFGSAKYGINYVPDRILLEMAAVVMAVFCLSYFLGVRAVWSRAREAGVALPARRFSRFLANTALIFCGLWFLAAIWDFCHWDGMRGAGYVLGFGLGFVGLVLLATAATRPATRDEREYRSSERRSLLPILVACLIVIGIFARTYLLAAERSEISKLQQPGMRIMLDEVKYSRWSDYQNYLRSLPDEGALQLPK